MSATLRLAIGMTSCNNRRYLGGAFDEFLAQDSSVVGDAGHASARSKPPLGDRMATVCNIIIVWAASRVRIRLVAWRRHVGARCSRSTRTAVG
jgi:hypothetical protein